MKVLWLTNSAAGASTVVGQNSPGRGWIASLSDLIKEDKNIELAVVFFNNKTNEFKFQHGGVIYYPIKDRLSTIRSHIQAKLFGYLWDTNLSGILKAVEDFNPDVIQLFGTESGMGDIVGKTTVPIVIHLQGLINPYLLNWIPRGFNFRSVFFNSSIKELLMRKDLNSEYSLMKKMAGREEYVIKNSKYFFGRTNWDRRVVRLLNPEIEYFHCNEVLRPFIYKNAGKWKNNNMKVIKLVSTINPQIYKGLDIVLQTAKILKDKTELNFEWNIIGLTGDNRIVKMVEKTIKNRFGNTSVYFKGVKQGDELVSELLRSNLFIHPSHIDNSPNSVCEAMLLGMPVIAGNVGGVSSLIENGINGILYNSQDPYDLASIIVEMTKDVNKLNALGKNAVETAQIRHNRSEIASVVKDTYQQILNNGGKSNSFKK